MWAVSGLRVSFCFIVFIFLGVTSQAIPSGRSYNFYFNSYTKCQIFDELGMPSQLSFVISSQNYYGQLDWFRDNDFIDTIFDGYSINDSTDIMASKVRDSNGNPVSGFIFYFSNDSENQIILRILIEQTGGKVELPGYLVESYILKNENHQGEEKVTRNEHIICQSSTSLN